MSYSIDETHNPELKSWVESANEPDTDFPIQNLPVGLFTHSDMALPSVGVAIGDQVLDVGAVAELLWGDEIWNDIVDACMIESLEILASLGPDQRRDFRRRISNLLRADNESEERYQIEGCLFPMKDVVMQLPMQIGNYTDFYASIYHATNIGKMFRPDQPLMPNYKWVPIGYHGRASSILPAGVEIRRPSGQTMADGADVPTFGPSRVLDYELELGALIGYGNEQGTSIPIDQAEEHILGLCLVNDWSARDIQRWEYQPLGPFLSKSFATTISPWLVTMEALAPFRLPAFEREAGDPAPLAYLDSAENRSRGGFDIQLEAFLTSEQMRANNLAPHRICASNSRHLYWTFAQMIAHHTSNGCNLVSGDLLASGTVSGPARDSVGSLIELTERGSAPITLPTGEIRKFLENGDEITLRAACHRDGFRRIGFGECQGKVVSAIA